MRIAKHNKQAGRKSKGRQHSTCIHAIRTAQTNHARRLSFSSMGMSFALMSLQRMYPRSSNSQCSFPCVRYHCPASSCHSYSKRALMRFPLRVRQIEEMLDASTGRKGAQQQKISVSILVVAFHFPPCVANVFASMAC